MPSRFFPIPSAGGTFRALGIVSCLLWLAFALVSREFAYGTTSQARPFGILAGIAAAAFVVYLAAVFVSRGRAGRRIRGREVLLGAVLMRLPLLLISEPVQEIDFYRYLWDGRSVVEGVSPYRFSPADLDRYREGWAGDDAGNGESREGPEEARGLLALQDRAAPVETIFRRIAHREIPTVYPVVSQTVFAGAAMLTPERAPVFAQMSILRAVITAFDIGTILLLLRIAGLLGLPPAFAVAYAWCPLVLKEFANASHMDSIAVFFTVAAFLCVIGPLGSEVDRTPPGPRARGGKSLWIGVSAVLLMIAIFAKWYPVLLVPVFVSLAWSRARWRGLLSLGPAFAIALALVAATFAMEPDRREGGGGGESAAETASRRSGLQTFLTRWEMNDLVFSLVRENLRPDPGEEATAGLPRPEPWYAITPEAWRRGWERLIRRMESRFGVEGMIPYPAFFGAQLICGAVLAGLIAGWTLRRWPSGREGALEAGRACFLALAAGWYLSATQNPWYWAWALPFLGFARSWIWLAVSGLALLYYARFWLIYHLPEPFWRDYGGRRFFDEIVVWFEHAPVLLGLAVAEVRRRVGSRVGGASENRTLGRSRSGAWLFRE